MNAKVFPFKASTDLSSEDFQSGTHLKPFGRIYLDRYNNNADMK
jgi:hypothetical protein